MIDNVVISLGGSLINPDSIQTDYLKRFSEIMTNYTGRAIVICGGGSVCREYNKAAKDILGQNPKAEDLDWMGIRTTHVNAELVRIILGERAYARILTEPEYVNTNQILIGGGYRPGNSSDEPAIRMADINKISTVVNLTNIDGVYDKDPGANEDAKHLFSLTWDDFFSIVGKEHSPGQHAPFCPQAGKLAKEKGISVVILDGKDLDNFDNYLNGKEYRGTKILTNK